MSAKENISRIQFHASVQPPEEFLHAPAIHVGTKKAATSLTRFRSILPSADEPAEDFKTRALAFSQHAVFHDDVLDDGQANEAHAQFLEAKGLPVTGSLRDSRSKPSNWKEGERIRQAIEALMENKILTYTNDSEDSGSLSHIVPSPHMNVRGRNMVDPQEQPVLPMDYSDVAPSSRTKRDRLRGHGQNNS